ncbi:hypothetical protein GFC01_13345 [Desulfofundulus thermobenzoicus]|uniref:Uncharacterized protein n=1 Tax=Desulfofundulus thermobenzoicus TaxID=29376 RepID=A0A6N7ISX3_9FIRM|nr:hypothetical protein [Desulfofundulus thermobenzoicus]MQL53225.1 hypothetical protein [Desulfofundulus thermobenzoicus]HHW43819.1 hypothetical protein [Desulfotomaculum sp.]
MSEPQGGPYNPAMIPLLLLLSSRPDMESRLSQLVSFLEATQNALQTMRTGLDALHATMMQMAASGGAGSPDYTTPWPPPAPPKVDPAPPAEVHFPDVKLPEKPAI